MSEELNEEMSEAEFEGEGPGFSALIGASRGMPVVEVRGEIDLATVGQLREAIGIAGSRMDGRALVAVDLRQAQFIDAYGARSLLKQARAMREFGGELRLIIAEEGPVGRVFEVLGVDRALDVYHDLNLGPS